MAEAYICSLSKVQRHAEICKEINNLYERKNHDYPLSEVHYAFFDTGLEFAATKRHLEYLEQKYGITIERYRAKIPVPLGVKKYGVPFLSKKISNNIQRLQKHGFKWEDTTPPIQGPWKCFWNWNSLPRSFGNQPVGKAIFPRCFRPTVMKSFQLI